MAILNNESGRYAANIVQVGGGPSMDPAFKEIYVDTPTNKFMGFLLQ